MGESIGTLLGTVEKVEFYEYPGKKVIIKIKVAINVKNPITSGIHVGNPIDGTCWIDFRYEKLPQVCFNCGLLGHVEGLCRNQPLELENLAPLGPWIISSQYGRRKMEDRDKKFHSNPSHSKSFGHYNPPVPSDLLEKLAAMKVNTPKGDAETYSQPQTSSQSTHKAENNKEIQTLQEDRNKKLHKLSYNLDTGNMANPSELEAQPQSFQAKRQKMEDLTRFLNNYKDNYSSHIINCSVTGGGRAGGWLVFGDFNLVLIDEEKSGAKFPNFTNTHLVRYKSNHCPILLDFSPPNVSRGNNRTHHPKRFEQLWTTDDQHTTIVRQTFGIIPKKIKEVQQDLQKLQLSNHNQDLNQQALDKEKELDDLLAKEELCEFTSAKIFEAIKDMKNLAAPGPDGLPARLKMFLPTIISPNQSAFVPGRLITDNTLIANEIFHYLTQTTRKTGFVGIKNDMAKAYDRVEWGFLKATANEAETNQIKSIITQYQNASGQLVNYNKSELIYSKKVPQAMKLTIQQILPMKVVDHYSKYLGQPTFIGKSKKQVFNFIQDKVWKKLKGWKEKNLSFAGRGTLIKAVAQAIPTYLMSSFLIPKGLCTQMEGMMSRFWWGSNVDKRKIHWVSWKKTCKQKNLGSMWFRDLRTFNQALLAKQGWRILTEPQTLLARTLKAKYFPQCKFLQEKQGNRSSYCWQSIQKFSWILKRGCFWLIVEDLIDPSSNLWNAQLINQTFLPMEASQILNIPLSAPYDEDLARWQGTKDGNYTVRSGYHAQMEWESSRSQQAQASNNSNNSRNWQKLWKLEVPPKQTHHYGESSTTPFHIWQARNQKNLNNKDIPITEVVDRALKILSEYHTHLIKSSHNPTPLKASVDRNNMCWSPPPPTFHKLNVDAHLSGDGRWGFGLVLRRDDGHCVGAATRACDGTNDVAMAEASGLREALLLIDQLQLNKVIIELDAACIVQAF
ncbi:hypothetical protein TSUD_392900 [Trifolium subterraneum]|uniref:CCHC-type domain-containing protein n=1 Tax=Trifolium subterraneum TaxID=3900 RepID=A0A2Z6NFW5_TRISU|nr:hypothetical protein TSUD_392900 [Trifolium subterraneum]